MLKKWFNLKIVIVFILWILSLILLIIYLDIKYKNKEIDRKNLRELAYTCLNEKDSKVAEEFYKITSNNNFSTENYVFIKALNEIKRKNINK